MKIGMFSYNSFLPNESLGWKDGLSNQIFLVQNPDGKAFASAQFGTIPSMEAEGVEMVKTGWQVLSSEIENLDKLIIYIGSYGAEKAILMARKNKISDTKLIFVMCDCRIQIKNQKLSDSNYEKAEVIMCECGGNMTMKKMFTRLMTT